MEIIYITILTFFASMVGTMTGFGMSTIMVPVFLLFYSLPETLLFVGIIHWFGDLWKILLFKQGLNWKLILVFGLSGIIASLIGASLTFDVSEKILIKVLGGFLLAYVIFLFLKPDFKLNASKKNMITGGALSGFFAGIFGVGGAVRATFLSAFDLPKAMYLATAGSIALLIDTTRIITYLNGGWRLEPMLLWGMFVFIPVSFISAGIAKRIISYLPQKSFRLFITIFLALIGLYFLISK
jgi:uncharacterized membrane protein YfcA